MSAQAAQLARKDIPAGDWTPEAIVTIKEIEEVLGIPNATVYRWKRAGLIEARIPLGVRRYGLQISVRSLHRALLSLSEDRGVAAARLERYVHAREHAIAVRGGQRLLSPVFLPDWLAANPQ